MNCHNGRIITGLCDHLSFLDDRDTALRIENDDPCPRDTGKAGHSSLACIAGSSRQDDNILLDIIFLRSACQQMRQNRECHIFKGDRRAVKQLQKICVFSYFVHRYDLRRVKLAVIGQIDTVAQFLISVIAQKQTKDLISHILIRRVFHSLEEVFRKCRHRHRHIQTAILCKACQNSL